MLKKVNNFGGSFDEDSQMKSIPIRLLTLINLLIDGTCEGGHRVRQAALTYKLLCITVERKILLKVTIRKKEKHQWLYTPV